MIDSVKSFLEYAKKDPLTTTCSVLFALAAFVAGNPEAIAFIGPSASALVVSVSSFVWKASIAVGLFLAAQTKTKKEEVKEEIVLDQKIETAVEEKVIDQQIQ